MADIQLQFEEWQLVKFFACEGLAELDKSVGLTAA
jgi:hypothetical protein